MTDDPNVLRYRAKVMMPNFNDYSLKKRLEKFGPRVNENEVFALRVSVAEEILRERTSANKDPKK